MTRFFNRKAICLLTAVAAASVIRTYQSMFNENTWNWGERV